MPLTFFEKHRYVNLTSYKWSSSERQSASKSVIFLFLGMSALLLMIFADYAMYQVVTTTAPAFSTEFGEITHDFDESSSDGGRGVKEEVAPQIDGNSSMADISRSFLQLANPLKDVAFSVDASICRPKASEPDHQTVILIICVLVFTLISVAVEVYVLRLRHLIMARYYPTAALRRAAWLRTYIRNNRGLFFRLVHRMRFKNKQVGDNRTRDKMKFFDWFLFANPILAKYLKLAGISRVFCAQCSNPGNPQKKEIFQENFTQCPRCGMFYCKLCQADLKGICVNCNVPMRIKSAEVDFEVWSSDEEYNYFYNRYFNRRKHDVYKAPKCPSSLAETAWPYSTTVRPDLIEKLQVLTERKKTLKEQEDALRKQRFIPPKLFIPKRLSVSSMTRSVMTETGTKATTRASTVKSSVIELKKKTLDIRREIEPTNQSDHKTEASSITDSSKISISTSSETSIIKTKYAGPSISVPSELSADTMLESRISSLGGTGKEVILSTPKFSSFSNNLSDLKPLSATKDSNACIDFSSIGGLSSLNCSTLNPPENFQKHMHIDPEFQELNFLPKKKHGTNKSNVFSPMNPTASESISSLSVGSLNTPGIPTLTRGTTKNKAIVDVRLSPIKEEGIKRFTSHRDRGISNIPSKSLQTTHPDGAKFFEGTNENSHQTYLSTTNLSLKPPTAQNTRGSTLISTMVFFEPPSLNRRSDISDFNQNSNNSNKNEETHVSFQKEVSREVRETSSSSLLNDFWDILLDQQDTNNSSDIPVPDNGIHTEPENVRRTIKDSEDISRKVDS
ncbi:unnamed protein product [Hymenolepis diminuta]|uniref:Dendritic cell-specific transmembrane protein-like domain-containing protein n=1 Tax=Hymenolepis diminuta TaxID=6216 RepID=A0A3P6WG31_HYMDI|nr:unnamed protein product [Hymenolepis diminuta]